MYLIFQGYVPLPDSIYHRVIYVWGCNRRQCMHKSGRCVGIGTGGRVKTADIPITMM